MIAIIDYGVGNLFSLESSLDLIGEKHIITSDPQVISNSDKIILPGVGAFADAITKLKEKGLDSIIKKEAKSGKHILGICLGMQLLFDESYEYGRHQGLGLIPGRVIGMQNYIPGELKIPHIGWNKLKKISSHPILKFSTNDDFVYFVHSYHAVECDKNLIATTEYGVEITAAVADDNVVGMQFHPEKSGNVGLNILKAFSEW